MLEVRSPYPQFYDRHGDPLDAGYVYIGTVDTNPEVAGNQVAITWDLAGTMPAAQPLRTLSGYIARGGTPARVFTAASDYSITVRDRNGLLIFTAMSANAAMFGTLTVNTLIADSIETDSICAEFVRIKHADDTDCIDPAILSVVEIAGVKVLCIVPPVDEAGSEILIGADDVTSPGGWLVDSLGRWVIPSGATAISDPRHVTSKGYVDGLTAALNALIVALTTRVDTAEDDIDTLEGTLLTPTSCGRVESDGTTVTGALNMTSVRDTLGHYTVTLTEELADPDKAFVHVTPDDDSDDPEFSISCAAKVISVTEVEVRMHVNGANPIFVDCGFFVSVTALPA